MSALELHETLSRLRAAKIQSACCSDKRTGAKTDADAGVGASNLNSDMSGVSAVSNVWTSVWMRVCGGVDAVLHHETPVSARMSRSRQGRPRTPLRMENRS